MVYTKPWKAPGNVTTMEMRYINVRLSDSTNKVLTTLTVLNTKLQADIIKITLIANIFFTSTK